MAFGSGATRVSNFTVKELESRRESSRKRGESSGSKTRVSGAPSDADRESSKESKVNWKKYVTLNPPNLVKFNVAE